MLEKLDGAAAANTERLLSPLSIPFPTPPPPWVSGLKCANSFTSSGWHIWKSSALRRQECPQRVLGSRLTRNCPPQKNWANSSALLYAFDPYINTSVWMQAPKGPQPTSVFTLNNFNSPFIFPSTSANSSMTPPPPFKIPACSRGKSCRSRVCVFLLVMFPLQSHRRRGKEEKKKEHSH